MLKHLKERRQSEEGFTLIELMVVVLIMGILMAIAIPTFLATQGSAHDAAAKSNATNALTNEKAYFESNQVFLDAPSSTNGNTLDSNLPWGTAANDVAALAGNNTAPFAEITSGTTSPTVLIEAVRSRATASTSTTTRAARRLSSVTRSPPAAATPPPACRPPRRSPPMLGKTPVRTSPSLTPAWPLPTGTLAGRNVYWL